MDCTVTSLPYNQIGSFTKIVVDYINGADTLRPFYKHEVSLEGLKQSIEDRKAFHTDRKTLSEVLSGQYLDMDTSDQVRQNIEKLASDTSFTIVTAHQPNIFTGYLYFIYKILHVIKLAAWLKTELPGYDFVPVYYMGSEDADLDELGKIYINGEEIAWKTDQKGAVGKMSPDGLDEIIARLEGEMNVYPFGTALTAQIRDFYLNSPDIQTATFRMVNWLFKDFGLVILLPDNRKLKQVMRRVFEDDLLRQTPSEIVEGTINELSKNYKVQANPRAINLFYLKDNIRERIVRTGSEWKVVGEEIRFTEQELLRELHEHTERFSPNVILRGLYQETILPNIAFIGGGGETAYWLELKGLFAHYHVPYPVLIIRNSFLFVDKKAVEKIWNLQFTTAGLFKDEHLLMNELVQRRSGARLNLAEEIRQLEELYTSIRQLAGATDPGLEKHVNALHTAALNKLRALEKKMLKAEKRKFNDEQRQVTALKERLFPRNGLQERVDNFIPYFAKYGPDFISTIYEHSPRLEQEFIILEQREP